VSAFYWDGIPDSGRPRHRRSDYDPPPRTREEAILKEISDAAKEGRKARPVVWPPTLDEVPR